MNRIPDIAEAALSSSERLLRDWLPDGKRRGAEWVARNPTRGDRRPGSFAVNLNSGQWADFATGEAGADLINLRAYLDGTRQGEAAATVAADLGLPFGKSAPRRAHRPRPMPTPAPEPKRPAPVALGTPSPMPEPLHPCHATPAAVWTYQDPEGRAVGAAVRFDHPEGKQVLPYSWDGTAWGWRAMPDPRPLFNLPALLARPEAVAIVTEGEKAACAAAVLLPEAVATTWPGGSKAWAKADWRPLKGRKAILWPDNDEPGLAAMGAIRAHLLALGAERVTLPDLPPGLPRGFDAADIEPAGLGRAFALALLAGKATAPEGLCPLCWARRVAAPIKGKTCPH
jgi:hypothetical protein